MRQQLQQLREKCVTLLLSAHIILVCISDDIPVFSVPMEMYHLYRLSYINFINISMDTQTINKTAIIAASIQVNIDKLFIINRHVYVNSHRINNFKKSHKHKNLLV